MCLSARDKDKQRRTAELVALSLPESVITLGSTVVIRRLIRRETDRPVVRLHASITVTGARLWRRESFGGTRSYFRGTRGRWVTLAWAGGRLGGVRGLVRSSTSTQKGIRPLHGRWTVFL